ncbi:hypothetical protein K523DRAFT_376636 [Schizophyllum commune Tattone D]|nr:hypothetical protein K523DRAFT_376636 [Schizophyllum commune Tattone D]
MQPRHPTRRAAINAQQCVESLTVQAFEMWKAYLLLANTILQAMFTESSNVELIAALIDARSSIALYHVEDLLRIMRTVLDAFVALEQAAVKEFTESPLAKLVNPVLDFFTLPMGIVTSDLHDLQTYLSRCIAQASQARASIRGLAERFPLQTLVEVRRGLTGQDTLVVHCAQAASCEALREAQHWRNQLDIARMSQQFPWNSWIPEPLRWAMHVAAAAAGR